MRKIAVVIYGQPGAGKGTQADLLAKEAGLIQLDIGSLIEETIYDPKNRKNSIILEQKRRFESGDLCEPLWVAGLIGKQIRLIAKSGLGIVLSGSLRTISETFGNKKTKGLLQVLEEEYGKKKIIFLLLKINSRSSVVRNSSRLVCSVCGKPVLMEYIKVKPKSCPVCGGALRKRTLDKPAVIKERLRAFRELTQPVLKALRRRGYRITEINGEPAPYIVHRNILSKLKRWL